MFKVINKSSNGFQVEDGKWFTCDKIKVLSKPLFFNLMIGDFIDDIISNSKGYIISFTVLTHKDQEEGVLDHTHNLITLNMNSKITTPLPVSITDKQREILRGQCLNIVFNAFFRDGIEIEYEANRDRAIKLSQKVFNELESANFYNW